MTRSIGTARVRPVNSASRSCLDFSRRDEMIGTGVKPQAWMTAAALMRWSWLSLPRKAMLIGVAGAIAARASPISAISLPVISSA
jgi:hypothetical protein